MHTTLKNGTMVYHEKGDVVLDDPDGALIFKKQMRYDTPPMAPDHIEPYTHGWLTGFMTGCIGTCVTLGAVWVLL
jgi:hypothetical protein